MRSDIFEALNAAMSKKANPAWTPPKPSPNTFGPPYVSGGGSVVQPGAADHQPATNPAVTVGNPEARSAGIVWPAAGADRIASQARGQALVDAVKDVGHLDVTERSPYQAWPLKGK
jgi:hypothetical protein